LVGANDRDELSKLSDLLDLMRAKGVIKFNGGVPGASGNWPTEILLGPPVLSKEKAEAKDPRMGKRLHYQNLLGRTNIPDAELDLLPDSA
jgi:hypothetical protein